MRSKLDEQIKNNVELEEILTASKKDAAKITEYASKLEESEKSRLESEEILVNQKSKLDSFATEIESLKLQVQNAKDDNLALQVEHDQKMNDITVKSQTTNIDQLNQLRSDFKTRNNQLLTENENLLNELETANKLKEALEKSQSESQSELASLKLELEDKASAIKNFQDHRNSLNTDINNLRK